MLKHEMPAMWRQQYSFSTMYSLSWNIHNVMEVENNPSLVGRICDIYMYNITYPRFLFELKATSQGDSFDKNLRVSLSVFQAICLIWHGKRVDSYSLFYIYLEFITTYDQTLFIFFLQHPMKVHKAILVQLTVWPWFWKYQEIFKLLGVFCNT